MRNALIFPILILALGAGCNREQADPAATAANRSNDINSSATAQMAPPPTDPQIVEGLSGRTARVELADGRTIFVTHNPDGTARMTGEGLDMIGRWSVSQGRLCFDWQGQPRECWPYAGPLQPGVGVQSTSHRGQVITTMLQEEPAPTPTGGAPSGNMQAPATSNAQQPTG